MTTATMTYGGADLPLPIQRAIARAMDPSFPIRLTSPERVALAALLRRVEARHGLAAFWVRRCNLAELFEKADRTVTNWLNALEGKGLLAKEQGRTRWGNFSCLTVNLTDQAIALLGLAATPDEYKASRKKTAAGHIKEEFTHLQSYQRHSAAPSFDETEESCREGCTAVSDFDSNQDHQAAVGLSREKGPQFLEQPKSRIPEDCRPLLEIGLPETAIFKLMKVASERGKRLGGIVAARLNVLKKAKKPFGLALTLARDNIDYSAIARLEAKRLDDKLKKEEQIAAVEKAKEKYRGKWVQLEDGRMLSFTGALPQMYRRRFPASNEWVYDGTVAGKMAAQLLAKAVSEGWQVCPPPVLGPYPHSRVAQQPIATSVASSDTLKSLAAKVREIKAYAAAVRFGNIA